MKYSPCFISIIHLNDMKHIYDKSRVLIPSLNSSFRKFLKRQILFFLGNFSASLKYILSSIKGDLKAKKWRICCNITFNDFK